MTAPAVCHPFEPTVREPAELGEPRDAQPDPAKPVPARPVPAESAPAKVVRLTASDRELVDAVREGRPGAMQELHQLVIGAIDRTLVRLLGRQDRDHDDLVQLTLEQLLRSILRRQFRMQCGLQHWSAALASRVAITELRRRCRRPSVLVEPHDLDLVGGSDRNAWEASARAQDTRDLVRRALSSLSPERAQVVYLYEVEGYQLGEIAALVGASPSAVQSRLVRGRRQLVERCRRLSDPPADKDEGERRHE